MFPLQIPETAESYWQRLNSDALDNVTEDGTVGYHGDGRVSLQHLAGSPSNWEGSAASAGWDEATLAASMYGGAHYPGWDAYLASWDAWDAHWIKGEHEILPSQAVTGHNDGVWSHDKSCFPLHMEVVARSLRAVRSLRRNRSALRAVPRGSELWERPFGGAS